MSPASAPALSPQWNCFSAGKITATLLLSFLALSPVTAIAAPDPIPALQVPLLQDHVQGPGPVIIGGAVSEGGHKFTMRHILHHGTYRYPGQLRRLDITPDTLVATEETPVLQTRPEFIASSRSRPIKRLSDRSKDTMEAYLHAYRSRVATSFTADAWISDEIPQPNLTDKQTVLNLARIAANAYIEIKGTEDWVDVGQTYNLTDDFGWEGDGLRGHIFADEDNSTVIIGLKGTSPAVFDGPETTTNDKVNDNLLFSCCCARVSYWWTTVCDCFSGTAYTCDSICLKDALNDENRYYRASLELYYNVTALYPDSNIWVIGHSLGGSISSLLGQTYGLPVVAFEAPGEALASSRLGLPSPPGQSRQSSDIAVHHFGHTADPIFMGTCNGPTSGCSIGGYAMETRCHAGSECVYDVVTDKGWRMGLGYHRIQTVIKDVIEKYDDVPECIVQEGCVDCFNWKFIEGNGTTTTSLITTKTSATSTSTCKTPGWWGCLDETTKTTTSTSMPLTSTLPVTSTHTKSMPSETCSHYGWFGGCLDPTTTSTPIPSPTHTQPTPTVTTTTCTSRGFLGNCIDPSPVPTTTCEHYGFLGKCLDKPNPTAPASTTSTKTKTKSHCKDPFFWWCWNTAPRPTGEPPKNPN